MQFFYDAAKLVIWYGSFNGNTLLDLPWSEDGPPLEKIFMSFDCIVPHEKKLTMMTWKRAIDLCSQKKCWKTVLLPTAVWIFFTCIREKANFLLAHIYSAIKVLHICWWH